MKPNLVFLHGGPGFKDYLRPFFEDLSDSFSLTFYNQLQGPSIGIDDLIFQLDKIVDSLNGKIILAGHSWGGVLATEYATRFSSKIHGLVLMNTNLCIQHWDDEFEKEKVRLGLIDAKREEIYFSQTERPSGETFLDEVWKTLSEETFNSLYESYIRHFDLRKNLTSFQFPVHLISGSNDVISPARVSKGLIPDRSCLEISDAGHFPFLRQEGRKIIHDFFRKNFKS